MVRKVGSEQKEKNEEVRNKISEHQTSQGWIQNIKKKLKKVRKWEAKKKLKRWESEKRKKNKSGKARKNISEPHTSQGWIEEYKIKLKKVRKSGAKKKWNWKKNMRKWETKK